MQNQTVRKEMQTRTAMLPSLQRLQLKTFGKVLLVVEVPIWLTAWLVLLDLQLARLTAGSATDLQLAWSAEILPPAQDLQQE